MTTNERGDPAQIVTIDGAKYLLCTAITQNVSAELTTVAVACGFPMTVEEIQLTIEGWNTLYLQRYQPIDQETDSTSSSEIVCAVAAADEHTYVAIGFMCTNPKFQRKGLGSFMMNYVVHRERNSRSNPRPVILSSTLAGERLYLKTGSREVARFKRFQLSTNKEQPIIEDEEISSMATSLGVTYRISNDDNDDDLKDMANLSSDSTGGANHFKDFKTFLVTKKGQESRAPMIYLIHKEGKLIAFGALYLLLGAIILGPLVSPDLKTAKLLFKLIVKDKYVKYPHLDLRIGILSPPLTSEVEEWESWIQSQGFEQLPNPGPIFQYDGQPNTPSFLDAFSRKIVRFAANNPVIM